MRLNASQIAAIKEQLAQLQEEHRALDDEIAAHHEWPLADELNIRRMKRRKLALKDQITRLESMLIPDEPA